MRNRTIDGGANPFGLLRDSLGLWRRFLPQLLALALVGSALNDLLIEGAVSLGYLNRLAGLVSLTLVVLLKLVLVIAMLEMVRPAMPAMNAAARADTDPGDGEAEPGRFTARLPLVLSIAVVPFFAYYAAWGLLGDTVRDYSRVGLARANPFDPAHSGPLLDVSGGWWLLASVALLWLIRRAAKTLRKGRDRALWSLLIVACEAGWAFVALYVVAVWKGGLIGWLADRRIGGLAQDIWQGISHPIGVARAAGFDPVDQASPGLVEIATGLFFYALLPIVWLTLATLIYRYDIHRAETHEASGRRRILAGAEDRWSALPQWLRDFVAHFWAGTAKRYRAVANSIRLVTAPGAAAIVVLVVAYRAADWVSAWAWLGLTRVIGPHAGVVWEAIAGQIAILLGSPSYPGDGVLPATFKICLLAATLERAFLAGRGWRALTPEN